MEQVLPRDYWVTVVNGDMGVTARQSEISRFYFIVPDRCELVMSNGDRIEADCSYAEFRKRLNVD